MNTAYKRYKNHCEAKLKIANIHYEIICIPFNFRGAKNVKIKELIKKGTITIR